MLDTKEARFEISTICNHRCVFCPLNNNKFKREKTVMPNSLFFDLIEKLKIQAPNINVITISGMGEPFLDEHIYDKLLYLKELGYNNVHILTNGSINDKQLLKKVLDLNILSSIRVSLHTVDEQDQIKICGKDNLKLIENNINFIIENKPRRTELRITTVLSYDYPTVVGNIVMKYADKCELLEIWQPHNWSNQYDYRNSVLISTTCGRPFNGPLQIQVDGTINMCCFDVNGQLLLGDFKNNLLKEIFSSKEYIDLREAHNNDTLDESNYICKKCDQRMNKSNALVYTNKYIDDRMNKISTGFLKFK